jgi:hypothetical protein
VDAFHATGVVMRLGVLSNERLNKWNNWTTLGPPLLNSLAANTNAELVTPPTFSPANLGEWIEIFRRARTFDALFWMQHSARPELPVHVASLLSGFVRRSAFVVDPWRPALDKIGTLVSLQRLDPCFVPYREAYRDLKARFPRCRFEWLPFGIDTEVFDSRSDERPIFAFWMGRRYEPLHNAMLRYCRDRRLEYRFREPGVYPSAAELGRTVGSSQYFLVTPPDLDNPSRTGGYSPLVMRYMEGLAGGARILGVLPRSGEFEAILPVDSILQVAPDGSDLAAKLDSDRANPDSRLAVERARQIVRTHHSWTSRAKQIYELLNFDKATGFVGEG